MSTKLTPKRQALLDAMKAAIDSGKWSRVPDSYGYTIRYTEERETPDWAQKDRGWCAGALYPFPTYTACVFLTLVLGGKVILGNGSAPWMGRRDQDITLKRAQEVLANPAAVWC